VELFPEYSTDDDGSFSAELSDVLLDDNDDSNPETKYLRSLVWQELERALSELPVEQQEVFELTEMQGLSFKEISKQTGVPINTLISRKRYAVLHLRERLNDLYNDLLNMS
jgi:RNA polymerase sigma factor (sigma-70 family)